PCPAIPQVFLYHPPMIGPCLLSLSIGRQRNRFHLQLMSEKLEGGTRRGIEVIRNKAHIPQSAELQPDAHPADRAGTAADQFPVGWRQGEEGDQVYFRYVVRKRSESAALRLAQPGLAHLGPPRFSCRSR